MGDPDMLETYLDPIPEAAKENARQLVHAMRLFALSAQRNVSPETDLPIAAATCALHQMQSQRLQACLDTILHSLFAGRDDGACAFKFGLWPEASWLPEGWATWSGTPRAVNEPNTEAWNRLRSGLPAELHLPNPGLPWARLVSELLLLAPRLHLPSGWIRLWKIRLDWIRRGPQFAEKALNRWWDRFGADAEGAQAVVWSRVALAFGGGRLDQARALLAEVGREGGAESSVEALVQWAQEGGALPSGESPYGPGRPEQSEHGMAPFVLGSDGSQWRWDGIWGTLGCWVACPGTTGSFVWAPSSARGMEAWTGTAHPDELERRAARTLCVETEVSCGAEPMASARVPGAQVRASFCVLETLGVGPTGTPVLGQVLGWVTWEWNHRMLPPLDTLIQGARSLVFAKRLEMRGAGSGSMRTGGVGDGLGLVSMAWFDGWVQSLQSPELASLWQQIDGEWLKRFPCEIEAGRASSGLDPQVEDMQRCVQLGRPTRYWARAESQPMELIPIGRMAGTETVLACGFEDDPGLERNLAVPPKPDPTMWNWVQALDPQAEWAEWLSLQPFWDPAFARFVRRLALGGDQPQHLAVVGHPNGMAKRFAAWLGAQRAATVGSEWECQWIPFERENPKSIRDWLDPWESMGKAFRVFRVPELAQRRKEIVGWVRRWSRRCAPHVDWDDEALAFIWRQTWAGQEPQLISVLARLAQEDTMSVGLAEVRAVFAEREWEPVERLDVKRPRPQDIASALHTTRRNSGRWNKTRAAQFLGWDPDTLVARMRDLSWHEGDVPLFDPWILHSSE